jgi:indole-3-glycerol phosphate synthase
MDMPTKELVPPLELIVAAKRQYVSERRSQTPIEAVRALASMQKRPQPVLNAVAPRDSTPVLLIGQIRRRESSLSMAGAAAKMTAVGVDAVALFTDDRVHGGSLDDLVLVTSEVDVPVVSQDVIVDEYQVVEMRAAGASALLLRSAALKPAELRALVSATQRNRMTAIVEVSTPAELEYALGINPYVIAISQRHFWSGEANPIPASELRAMIPPPMRVMLADSLHTLDEVRGALSLDVDAVLVDEGLLMDHRQAGELPALLRRG